MRLKYELLLLHQSDAKAHADVDFEADFGTKTSSVGLQDDYHWF